MRSEQLALPRRVPFAGIIQMQVRGVPGRTRFSGNLPPRRDRIIPQRRAGARARRARSRAAGRRSAGRRRRSACRPTAPRSARSGSPAAARARPPRRPPPRGSAGSGRRLSHERRRSASAPAGPDEGDLGHRPQVKVERGEVAAEARRVPRHEIAPRGGAPCSAGARSAPRR